ncbi:synaptotagmin-1 [Microplitis demolitor]|uniref:synaptotagmin-1 n=1 Tax=Microplitis demolitor TaxID=69319 RepID=UPI0004CCC590|nr:synaptotagmin-1 [Microplitis demolitor]XP_008550990.1 synaptotagmin-1 [Microplitis demolitor]
MFGHSMGLTAVLTSFGAATGALSAWIVYAMCVKRRHFPGGKPLNWFEKDLLDRAKEAAKSSTQDFIELGNVAGGIVCDPTSGSRDFSDNVCDEVEWTRRDPPYDTSILDSREVIQRLSEGDDEPRTPVSPIAPPLPGGALVASDERMVIVRPQPRSSHGSRLSSDSDSVFHKQSSWSSSSSLDDVGGELQLSLSYDSTTSVLTVKLLEAHDLRARELSGNADPYAKIRLLPDRSNTWQTKVHRCTLNPVFDEEFTFEVSSLTGTTLEVLLYDFDPASKHRALGYVRLPLPLNNSEYLGIKPVTLTRPIHRYGAEGSVYRSDPLGELMVSLCYDANAAKLTVIVIRAINLSISDESGNQNYDTYVKVTIFKDGKSFKKKRTVICRDQSPVWNDVLNFDLGGDILSNCLLEFSIVRTSGDLLARCEVSKKCQREFFHRVLSGKGASVQKVPLTGPDKRTDSS